MSTDNKSAPSESASAGREPSNPPALRALSVAAGTVVFFIIWPSLALLLALALGAGTDVTQITHKLVFWWGGNFIGGAGAFVAAFAVAKLLAPDFSSRHLANVIGGFLLVGLALAVLGAIIALSNTPDVWSFGTSLVFMFIFGEVGVESALKWLKANFENA